MVPGIANDSKAAYIQSFCEYSTNLGFRVFVLNHLGVLPVKLTSRRIFTYGTFSNVRPISMGGQPFISLNCSSHCHIIVHKFVLLHIATQGNLFNFIILNN